MSLAVFALVVAIWMALLVPLARRGRAELAVEASQGGSRLSSGGARPWTTGNLPAEPTDDELAAADLAARLARRRASRRRAAVRRRRVLLALVAGRRRGRPAARRLPAHPGRPRLGPGPPPPRPGRRPAGGGPAGALGDAGALGRPGARVQRMSLGEAAAGLRARLDAKHRAREVGIRNARQAVRCSANAIRAAHRTELERAGELLAEARELLEVAASVLAAHPDVLYAGFLQDAQKEYAEALATRALVAGDRLPPPEDVGVGDAPYLNGLAETIGELRRHLLDVLRAGDVPRATALFGAMEEIHALLADLDYPDAITGNLRRSTDVARSIIERTRSDLTLTVIQRDLADALRGQEPPGGTQP